MSVTVIKPKDRAEWLEHRKSGVGSSEVATILGLNPFETPYQLWRRKKGLDAPKDETFAMKAGHYLEDAVSMFWADETGREVIKSSAGDWLFVNNEKDFMRVSPDRTFWLPNMPKNNANKGILECKTTQKEIDPEDLPKHWFCQVQYLLGVSEYEQGSLAWLSSGREFGYRDIEFVPDFFGWMSEEVERFWIDNILGDQEPEATSVTDIIKKYSRHTDGKIVETTEEVLEAYTELKGVKDELKTLEEKKEALESTIKLAFGDAEAISYAGKTLVTWKATKDSEKFDSKLFCKEHPEMEQQYTITVPGSRRFLLK
ncbi:MAG: YqaJ viral recombinase family protein [Mediterranea sp.]|nr:YqaJ viral recombinase family protein [Mediterranea sp.]